MAQVLKYKIVNCQVASQERHILIDGQPAVANFLRTVLEAQPLDEGGKTFTAVLPADALAQFPEGAVITVTVDVDADSTLQPAPPVLADDPNAGEAEAPAADQEA